MPKRFLIYSRTQPARTILVVVALLTFFAGLFILTPWFTPLTISVATTFKWATWIGAIINSVVAIPALYAIKKNTPEHIARGSMWLFMWYVFVTLTRILTGDPTTLLWVPTLIIAGVLSVLYIEQSHIARRDRGD